MIPRIIHQVWIGDVYKKPEKLMATWKDMNPSCEYVEWNEESLSKMSFRNQRQIDEIGSMNGKCNIMRYEILYKYGGIILDADSECISTLDDFFFENTRFTCYENEEVGIRGGVKLLSSGVMGAVRGDGFLKACISELRTRRVSKIKSHCICGNLFLATMELRLRRKYPMKIYPSWYFIPKHGTGVEYEGSDKIYAKQYWGSTLGTYDEL